jgi:hypothetical protein
MSGTTITSNSSSGYDLGIGVANPVIVASGVTITNVGTPALGSQQSTYWTITNYGTLLATGKSGFSDGVLLDNGGGAVTNMAGGLIKGYYAGVSIAQSGTVVNQGSIATENTTGQGFIFNTGGFTPTTAGVLLGGGGVYNAGSGLITSYLEGVDVGAGGSVVNAGTIFASSATYGIGVVLVAGGSLTNAASGTISAGLDGVLTFSAPSTVINQGVIIGLDNQGVGLIAGGFLSNASSGRIGAYSSAVYASGPVPSTVINAGILFGYANAGAWLNAGGSVTNIGAGYIYGYYFGVRITNGQARSSSLPRACSWRMAAW